MKQRTAYTPPVSTLLTLGEPNDDERSYLGPWRDYIALGIGDGDAPELVRMACDSRLHESEEVDAWGPLHAWRALGQVRAEAAVGPLLALLTRRALLDDDWAMEDLPVVLAKIGSASLEPLRMYLADARNQVWARLSASSGLERIAVEHPALRDEVVRALAEQLRWAKFNGEIVNGSVISSLSELRAVEVMGAIGSVRQVAHFEEEVLRWKVLFRGWAGGA